MVGAKAGILFNHSFSKGSRANEQRCNVNPSGIYQGPLGLVVYEGASFFASKDGFPIGTCDTLEEAMETLAWKAGDSEASAMKAAKLGGFELAL
jgi:hypothetical protein